MKIFTNLPNAQTVDAIEQTGQTPRRLKTDNEAVFTSKLFRFGLWWLGIKHERSQPGHPWQNGRIERLFGTLKQKAKGFLFDEKQMQEQLNLFCFWYNHVRTHQHLHGNTPFEAYHGLPVTMRQPGDTMPAWFQAWHGRLAGYWFKPG
ncbi:MAG: integrase core domain-containing protein [Alcanivoracaceae bacterium]